VVSGNGTMTGRIGGPNLADRNTVARSALGDGIQVDITGDAVGQSFTAVILVQNNVLTDIGDDGIQVLHRDNNETLDLTIADNLISNTASEGIRLFTDHDLAGVAADPLTNLSIARNVFAGIPATIPNVVIRSRDTASVCASIAANTRFDGAPSNEIELFVDSAAQLKVHQASLAALIAAKGLSG
jgi:hypothetical protein